MEATAPELALAEEDPCSVPVNLSGLEEQGASDTAAQNTKVPDCEDYVYEPLPDGHIRLVYITSRLSKEILETRDVKDEDLQIEIRLETVKLRKYGLTNYQALSYCWAAPRYALSPAADADAYAARWIYCEGRRVSVTANLFGFLYRRACENSRSRQSAIWIDALCIDQTNETEKSAQVSIMDHIYSNASSVIIWLGDDRHHSYGSFESHGYKLRDWAFPLMKEKGTETLLGLLDDWDSIESTSSNSIFDQVVLRSPSLLYWMRKVVFDLRPDESEDELYGNLGSDGRRLFHMGRKWSEAFSSSDWWNRAWTLQEIGLAKSPYVQHGLDKIRWTDLLAYAKTCQAELKEHNTYLVREQRQVMNRIMLIEMVRLNRAPWKLQSSLSTSRVFRELYTRRASNSYDKIYAGLGLFARAKPPVRITADYSLPISQVMVEATRKLFDQDLLRIIHIREPRHEGVADDVTTMLPSWVLDWRRSLDVGHNLTRWDLWKFWMDTSIGSRKFLKQFSALTTDQSYLTCCGLLFGTIAADRTDLESDPYWKVYTVKTSGAGSMRVQNLPQWAKTASNGRRREYVGRKLSRAGNSGANQSSTSSSSFDPAKVECEALGISLFDGEMDSVKSGLDSYWPETGDWLVYLFGSQWPLVLRLANTENLVKCRVKEPESILPEDLRQKFILIGPYFGTYARHIVQLAVGEPQSDDLKFAIAANLNCMHTRFTIV